MQTSKIENRLDKLENKLDKILSTLTYLSASDNEKKFIYPDGSINYDAICKACDGISKEMIKMRNPLIY